MLSEPLVSAIMPTRGRQQWAREALDMFLVQTWPVKELVIVDDLMEPSFPRFVDLGANVIRIPAARYSIGQKRNMAVSRASGSMLMHWDSDDIYTPDRMEHQVQTLLANEQADLAGYDEMEFIDVERNERWRFRANKTYAAGVSMTYWRETWEARRFDASNSGEDSAFAKDRHIVSTASGGRIVARIHSGNTCTKRDLIRQHPDEWERIA